MESLLSFSKTLNPSSIPNLPIPPQNPKPSFSPKTLTLIQSSTPKTLTLKSLPSFLKPAIISLTVSSSLFLSRHSLPSLATPSNPNPSSSHSQSQSQSQSQSHHSEVNSLRSLLHQKVKHHNLPEAIDIINRLIRIDPSDPSLLLLKANLQAYNGETDKAIRQIEHLLSADPFLVEAYHVLVMAAARSRDADRLDAIAGRVQRVMRDCGEGSKARDLKLLLAQIWIVEGRFGEALRVYDEMVGEDGRDFRPFLCRGIVFTLMRRMEEAKESFERYRELVPEGHPYAKLFERNMSGIDALLRLKEESVKVG